VFSARTEGGAWLASEVVPTTAIAVPAAQRRRVVVTPQNHDATYSPDVSYLIVRAAHQTAGVVDFTALARIPIQGTPLP